MLMFGWDRPFAIIMLALCPLFYFKSMAITILSSTTVKFTVITVTIQQKLLQSLLLAIVAVILQYFSSAYQQYKLL